MKIKSLCSIAILSKLLWPILVATGLLFAITFTAPALANGDGCNSCGTEHVTDLIAGGGNEDSAMVVGDVIVSNCESFVCVEYVLDDAAIDNGWLITETHVEVAETINGIPQTKKGNPIPGHFEDVQYFELGVQDYRYCVSFEDIGAGVAPGSVIDVAAHAVITRPNFNEVVVWQIGDVEDRDLSTGLLNNYADEFNWGDPAGPTTKGPGLTIEKPVYANPFIVGSSEPGEFPYNSNFDKSYATDFNVQWEGALPAGGELIVSWSPGQSEYEEKQVTIDGIGPAIFAANGDPSPGLGWFFDTYPLVEDSMQVGVLDFGTHTINFQHTAGDGTFWDWIRLEQPPGLESETAWADGCSFPGKNWATFICGYVVQGCPSCPEITYYDENVIFLETPLASVQAGVTTETVPQVFAEYAGTDHGGFTLDIDASNATNTLVSPDGFSVAADTPVCSYYVHFDDNGIEHRGLFSLTFGEPVMGLIVAGTYNPNDIFFKQGINTLCDTDVALGNGSTTYPAPASCGLTGGKGVGDARGLEIYNSDPTLIGNQDPVDIQGNTVYFDLNIYDKHDSLRIILPAL